MKRHTLTAILAIALLVPAFGRASLVSGVVIDSNSKEIVGVRVSLYAPDGAGDVLIGEAVTTCLDEKCGFYAIEVDRSLTPDVYARVDWEFPLRPSSFYNDGAVRLVDERPSKLDAPTFTYDELRCGSSPAPGCLREERAPDDVVIHFVMRQAQPAGLENLLRGIQQTLDTVRLLNAGQVEWNPDFDVPVHVLTSGGASSSAGEIFVPETSFNAEKDDKDKNRKTIFIFHETAHVIHYHHNGGSLPMVCVGPHDVHKEDLPGCALKEGYASYIALLTAERVGIDDAYWRLFRDAGDGRHFQLPFEPGANTLWRGEENAGSEPDPTGREGTRFESGERVEGAFSGFLFAVHDASGFATNFAAMAHSRPENPYEFLRGLIAEVGPGTPAAQQIYHHMQAHGIVFNRVRFGIDPLSASPFVVDSSQGDHQQIDGYTFLRGRLRVRFEAVTPGELGIRDPLHSVANAWAEVRVKPASSDLDDAPAGFTQLTSPVPFEAGEIEIDTALFGDGDYDLLIAAENADGFVDDFLPTWNGDGNPAVDTDEKYLKLLGAWFDADRDPATDPVRGGMVILDNTPPKVRNFQPQ